MKKRQKKIRQKKPITPVQSINPDDICIEVNPDLPQPRHMLDVLKEELATREAFDRNKLFAKRDLLDQFGLEARSDDNHVYELGKRKWICQPLPNNGGYYLDPSPNRYLGFYPLSCYQVRDMIDFHKALNEMTRHETELRTEHPDNWWTRFKIRLLILINNFSS